LDSQRSTLHEISIRYVGCLFLYNLHLNKAAALKESQDLTIFDFLFDSILSSTRCDEAAVGLVPFMAHNNRSVRFSAFINKVKHMPYD